MRNPIDSNSFSYVQSKIQTFIHPHNHQKTPTIKIIIHKREFVKIQRISIEL